MADMLGSRNNYAMDLLQCTNFGADCMSEPTIKTRSKVKF